MKKMPDKNLPKVNIYTPKGNWRGVIRINMLRKGMCVKNEDGDILRVTGNVYDNGFDYMVPLDDGYNYSPLLLQ